MRPEDVAAIDKSVSELHIEAWSPLTTDERDLLRRALPLGPEIERRAEKEDPTRRDTNGWLMS